MEACTSAQDAWGSYVSKLALGASPTQAEIVSLSRSGLVDVLVTLLYDQLEDQLQTLHIRTFWDKLVQCNQQQQGIQAGLLPALQALAEAVRQQFQQLHSFAQQLLLALAQQVEPPQQQLQDDKPAPTAAACMDLQHSWQQKQWQQVPASTVALLVGLCDKHRTAVASILMATAPLSLPGVLLQYYQQQLQQLCDAIQQQHEEAEQAAGAAAEGDSSEADVMSEDDAGSAHDVEQRSPSAAGSPDISQQARRGGNMPPALPDPYQLMGKEWCAAVAGVAACLDELGLAAASEEAFTRVINSHVLRQLRALATQELDQAVLPRCQQLVCAGPLAFLSLVLGQGPDTHIRLQEWQLRLTYLMLETMGALRSSDMFDIVIDYPDSTPALADLALCLQHTNMAGQFAATFKSSLQQRLLHAGAATSDIIQTYINTIKAMRQLGKSGVLLDIVSDPIRSYLRNRPDTIRCIVSMLTEHDNEAAGGPGGSLLEELQAQQAAGTGASGFGSSSGGLAGSGGLANVAVPPSSVTALSAKAGGRVNYNWCVSESEGDEAALRLLEALQAGPEGTDQHAEAQQAAGLLGLPVRPGAAASAALLSGNRVDADVVSMLIGIYGGPLLFMDEYRCMLADRLLAKDEYDCEREITTLELLKIRFGDAGLHPCEVMLKDLADSKRLDTNVRALPQQQVQAGHPSQALAPGLAAALAKLRATICSYLFWPELPEHDLTLPAELQAALEVYAERFRHLKAPRKLKWRPTLGMVELTVTVGDSEPIDFRVTPAHAALLLQFSDDSPAAAAAAGPGGSRQQQQPAAGGGVVLSAAQLSAALGAPVPVVRRKAMFWVAAGVLLERRGQNGELMYSRATSIDPSRIVSREVTDMSWSDDSRSSNSAEDRIIAEMGPFENFIIGLLTNCGTLSVDRLHNMLRVFVVGEPKYEGRTQEQLAAFLQVMVARDKIEVHNGMYSRKKAQS